MTGRVHLGIWLIALLGCLLMAACTRWGVGITPDSSTYVGMARSLLDGHGLSVWTPDGHDPISQYPPLYSCLLAAAGYLDLEPVDAARWLNLSLFGANTVLIGVVVLRSTGSGTLALLASGFYASSEISLEMHSVAWTEPLFIFLGFSGLYLLSAYLEGRNRVLLLLAAALIALAFLSRYVGIVLVGTGVLAILRQVRGMISRILAALGFLLLTTLPSAIWFVRNARLAGSTTNRDFAYYPFELSASDTIQLTIPLAFVFAVLWLRTRASSKGAVAPGAPTYFMSMLLLFIFLYVLLLVASFTFADPTITVTNRLFAPVYMAMAIVAICHGIALGGVLKPGTRSRHWALFFGTALVIVHLFNATVLVTDRYRNGFGYSSRIWVESETMDHLRNLPGDTVIYTNAGYAVATLTGNPTTGMPADPQNLPVMVESMHRTRGVAAFFEHASHEVQFSGEELGDVSGLEALFEAEDGRVFRVQETGGR